MTDETDKPDLTEMNLWQRISAVRAEIQAISKDKTVEIGQSSYDVVTSEAVNAALRPLLVKYGLVDYITLKEREIVPTGVKYGQRSPRDLVQYRGTYEYTVRNVDKDQFLTIEVEGHGDDSGDKGPGKATTYAQKTGRSKVFSIPIGEDEEGRVDPSKYVDPRSAPLTDEQLDEILRQSDDWFGDDSEEVNEKMCAVFGVDAVAKIPSEYFAVAMKRLRITAVSRGVIEDDSVKPDDV